MTCTRGSRWTGSITVLGRSGGVYTNGAEEFFSRMRRAEIGHHHHIAGPYLIRYAQEAAWREDRRRVDNGRQVQAVMGLAMANRPSVARPEPYWERREWWLASDARPWQPDAVSVLSDKLVFRPRLTPIAGRDVWHP
jgi:hypothetical protein